MFHGNINPPIKYYVRITTVLDLFQGGGANAGQENRILLCAIFISSAQRESQRHAAKLIRKENPSNPSPVTRNN